MKTDSIIFDLDGTLWDSIDGIAASWNEALAERFPDVPRRLSAEDVRAVLGKTIPEIGRAFFPGLAQPRIDEIMAYRVRISGRTRGPALSRRGAHARNAAREISPLYRQQLSRILRPLLLPGAWPRPFFHGL